MYMYKHEFLSSPSLSFLLYLSPYAQAETSLYGIMPQYTKYFWSYGEMPTESNKANNSTSTINQSPKNKLASPAKHADASSVRLKAFMFAPKYWLIWLGLAAMRLCLLLPYPLIMRIGRLLGHLARIFIRRRIKIAEQNFKLAMPELSDKEIKAYTKEHFANVGMGILETGMAWYWPDRRLKKLVHIDPEEEARAKELAASNKGIVVLTCHFVTLELMARIYGTFIKKGVGVYRPNDNPVIEYLQVKGRIRSNLYLVDRHDMKSTLKALMKGLPIWYAPDQDYGRKVSIFVPFFAVKDAATVTGTAGLARIKNTVVQPSYTIRLPNYQGYQLHIDPILEDFPKGDNEADATTCNQAIEAMIRQGIPQYMWLHRRFKTQPDPKAPPRYQL